MYVEVSIEPDDCIRYSILYKVSGLKDNILKYNLYFDPYDDICTVSNNQSLVVLDYGLSDARLKFKKGNLASIQKLKIRQRFGIKFYTLDVLCLSDIGGRHIFLPYDLNFTHDTFRDNWLKLEKLLNSYKMEDIKNE